MTFSSGTSMLVWASRLLTLLFSLSNGSSSVRSFLKHLFFPHLRKPPNAIPIFFSPLSSFSNSWKSLTNKLNLLQTFLPGISLSFISLLLCNVERSQRIIFHPLAFQLTYFLNMLVALLVLLLFWYWAAFSKY